MKYTRFRDIPQLTRSGPWECDFALTSIWPQIEEWKIDYKLDLDPDFQRSHVWTEAQQIAWLEFFLRGGKTGRTLYFNNTEWDMPREESWCCIVDGKQRLEAIRRFAHNEIPAFGSLFREFTDTLRMHLSIKINMNNLPTRAAVLQWYLDMNAGGTPHSAEEITRVRELLKAERT